jgi:nicotinamide mononucleotide transporter
MATTWLEFLAVLFGILSVWFARKENIWVYPTGIINVLIYVYLCYHAGLYADMGINAFYFVMSAYGWYNWARRDRQQEHVHITRLPASGWIYNIILLIISFFLIYQVLVRFTDSTVPGLDSFTTSIFIVGMWLMARKKIENWLAWILGDLLVIPLFAWKGLVFTSIQYIIFLLIAVMGYIKWREIMAQKQVHA